MPAFPGVFTGGYTRTEFSGIDPYGGSGSWNNHPANFEISDWLGGGWDGANGQSVAPAPCTPSETAFTVTLPSDAPISLVTDAAALTPGTWVEGSNSVNVWITTTTDGPSNYVFRTGRTVCPTLGFGVTPSHSRTGPRQYSFNIGTATGATLYELTIEGVTQTVAPGTPVSHTFATGGYKSVYYKVTDANGLWTVYALYLRVNIAPVAAFTWSETGSGDYPVTFDGTGSSDPDNYPTSPMTYFAWDFGDGSGTAFGSTKLHNYATDGEFDVTLTVSDGEDTDSVTHTITVSPTGFGAAFDHAATLFTALNEGTGVRVNRFRNFLAGGATRDGVKLFSNAKNPSVWVDDRGGVGVSYTDRSSGQAVEQITRDGGANWVAA